MSGYAARLESSKKNTEDHPLNAQCGMEEIYIQGVEVSGIKEKMRREIEGLGII